MATVRIRTQQLTVHAILGATLAYVNGGNPAAGGSAAVASEAAATYLKPTNTKTKKNTRMPMENLKPTACLKRLKPKFEI